MVPIALWVERHAAVIEIHLDPLGPRRPNPKMRAALRGHFRSDGQSPPPGWRARCGWARP